MRGVAVARLAGLLAQDVLTAQENADAPEGRVAAQRCRARRIREALEALGPFYIKVGQVLATRPDLVSGALVTELERLQGAVTVAPFAAFEPVLEEELGRDWRRLFREVDTGRPCGSASLAQVYPVVLHDGSHAVLKVQRPGAAGRMRADMAALGRAARMAGRAAPRLAEVLDLDAVLQGIFDYMRPELDFTAEAAHMEAGRRAAAGFRHLTVPAVRQAGRRVLIQSVAPGRALSAGAADDLCEEQRERVGAELLRYMYRGYFVEHFFHADPHPGNVFLHPETGATLIDWGMAGRVDRHTGTVGALAFTSIAQNDARGLAAAWLELGRSTPRTDLPGFRDDLTRVVPQLAMSRLDGMNLGSALSTILRCAARRGIRTSPMIGMLGKSMANVECTVRGMAPNLSAAEVFREALMDVMGELARRHLSQEQVARRGLELLAAGDSAVDEARAVLRGLACQEGAARMGSSPGHGIGGGGEGRGPLARYGGAAAGWALAAWAVHRVTRHGPRR
ncbi:AarF/UbiB family protein [Streptomyces sp. NPDC045431]|uniref:ABC1 kinase family protein n=1 Tax=Streptomyces sp. NPDC045431 TaxID=3155613 RepID=UPI0033D5CF33